MTDNEILKVAAAAGIDKAAMVDADDLVFEYEFRKYCEMNNCGNYGKNYGCPPDCGTPAEMEQKARKYQKALVLQTIQPVKDITDASETGPLKMCIRDRTGSPLSIMAIRLEPTMIFTSKSWTFHWLWILTPIIRQRIL